jgi:hypothetical protein
VVIRKAIKGGIDLEPTTGRMTRQQQIAIERPCRLAVETMHPRYRDRAGLTTVVLTVNSGYE